MKLTEIDESDMDRSTELVRNISRSSNSQNKVTDADFFSTHPFHVRMEQHTYGRIERENPEKISQSIQLDKETAQFLVNILCKEFDIH